MFDPKSAERPEPRIKALRSVNIVSPGCHVRMSAPVMAVETPKVAAPPGVTAIVIPLPSVATEELGRDASVVPTI